MWIMCTRTHAHTNPNTNMLVTGDKINPGISSWINILFSKRPPNCRKCGTLTTLTQSRPMSLILSLSSHPYLTQVTLSLSLSLFLFLTLSLHPTTFSLPPSVSPLLSIVPTSLSLHQSMSLSLPPHPSLSLSVVPPYGARTLWLLWHGKSVPLHCQSKTVTQ